MINEMKTKDFILLFDQVWSNEDIVGEKDFFEFMKRANRDLTPHQRYVILNTAIQMIKKGE